MATGPGIEITIRDKRFTPEGPPLFADFRLSIAPATVMVLVGPSGVGKSSLLRMIGGIDSAFDGEIRIGSKIARDALPPGFVLQDARLLPWLTAIDNIRAVAPDIKEARARELLDRVGLHGAADAFPHELSGGMQRRVALARAVSVNADLLLLDEPFVSLDDALAARLRDELALLVDRRRVTTILVTHDVDEAARLADRLFLLAPRPAHVLADVQVRAPRAERSEDVIAWVRTEVARSLGTVAPSIAPAP